jgi:hypothetical protein
MTSVEKSEKDARVPQLSGAAKAGWNVFAVGLRGMGGENGS